MTFEDALLRITSDHMPELALDTHTEARLLRLLGDAHADTSIMFGFLRHQYRVPVEPGNVQLAIPEPTDPERRTYHIQRVERVSFRGRQLFPGPRETASLDESHLNFIPGYPRYFYWRPESWNIIGILPKAPVGGNLIIDAITRFNRSPAKTEHIWDAMHESFHDIVVLTAAKRAFEASFEPDNAAMIGEQLSRRRQEFSLFLQRRDLSEIPVGGQG